jgi:general L-amino acid transport system permease protein
MQRNGHRIAMVRQVLVIAALSAIVVLVASNIAGNLERKGLSLSFEFLRRPASFDIPFKLIDFSSRDTYARAAVVAVLNTVLVAVLAIVTATVVGVAFGIFLLSPNPLLRRTALCCVEVIKNTPQLLQVLFWYVVILRQLPNARESFQPLSGVFLNVRGLFVPTVQVAAPADYRWLAWLALAVILTLFGYALRTLFIPQRADTRRLIIAATGGTLLASVCWLASGAQTSLSWPELRGFNFVAVCRSYQN